MKKPYAVGALLVACSTAALIGLGSTANASVSGKPMPPSHVSVTSSAAKQGVSPNRCDGDHDSDDIGCRKPFVNRCDGDHDSDDIGCGKPFVNRCDGDHDSDDIGCGGPSVSPRYGGGYAYEAGFPWAWDLGGPPYYYGEWGPRYYGEGWGPRGLVGGLVGGLLRGL